MEMGILPGKCKCGRKLDMRIVPLDDNHKEVIGWMIYGICEKCKEVLVIDISKDAEEPILDRDYTIDYNKIGEGKET